MFFTGVSHHTWPQGTKKAYGERGVLIAPPPPHRFGFCSRFIPLEGTSKCRTYGCVAYSHVCIYSYTLLVIIAIHVSHNCGSCSHRANCEMLFYKVDSFSEDLLRTTKLQNPSTLHYSTDLLC